MNMRFAAIAATALAATGFVLATTFSASAATPGLHHLYVKKPDTIHSLYIQTVNPAGFAFSACRELPSGTDWVDANQDLVNGKKATLITFTSNDCGAGYSISRDFTMPSGDAGGDFHANMN